MHEQEHKLQSLLTGQNFNTKGNLNELLETAKGYTHAYAQATNGIAVLSDFQNNVNHIYSGLFGQTLGLPEYAENKDSVFEHEVFVNISDEELVERHILELRFSVSWNLFRQPKRLTSTPLALCIFKGKGCRPCPCSTLPGICFAMPMVAYG